MCRNYNDGNYKATEGDKEDSHKRRDIIFFLNRKTLHLKTSVSSLNEIYKFNAIPRGWKV